MWGFRRLLALSLVVISGCLPKSCEDGCSQNGDADCLANNNPTGISMPPSPAPPLTLQCRSLNTRPNSELEWELTIGGGTSPYAYTLNFGDGTPAVTSSASSTTPRGRHEYARPGDYQFVASVADARGQTQTCAIAYSAPTPDLSLRCSATPRTGTAPLTVQFDVPPGGREGCIGPCTVTWYFGDGESSEGGHAVHEFTQPGPTAQQTFASFAELRDGLDRSAQCRMAIQVLPGPGDPTGPVNLAPAIDTLTASPQMVLTTQTSTISGSVSDPDPGDTVSWSLSFDSQNSGVLSPSAGTGPILSTYTPAASFTGTAIIRALAVDSHGAFSSYRSVHVAVSQPVLNRPPVLVSLTASPAIIFVGVGSSQIAGLLSDPDNDALTWTLELDPSSTATGNISPTSGSGNAIAATFTATGGGLAVVRATGRDPDGLTATGTVTVNVVLGAQ